MNNNITSLRLNESYFETYHKSGLKILIYPMKDCKSSFAMFSVKFGSLKTQYIGENGEIIKMPAGTAHFLEHKMFEGENGDAFDLFSKTGADSNAYTSADKTAFYFSCSDNFYKSLEILLEYVTKPYFTETSVKKEQKIIKQEIKMFMDNPDWVVYANMLKAMYHNENIGADIAGTLSSVMKITPEILYKAYNCFYDMSNCALAVSGNVDIDAVLETVDKIIDKITQKQPTAIFNNEPFEVRKKHIQTTMPVSLDIFNIGFKQKNIIGENTLKNQIIDELLCDVIAGDITNLYKELYYEGKVNQTFDTDNFSAENESSLMFCGESRNPMEVYEKLCDRINYLQKNGVEKDMFELSKLAAYGKHISTFSKAESIASAMIHTYFNGKNLYDALETAAQLNINDVNERLIKSVDIENSVLSVIKSVKEK